MSEVDRINAMVEEGKITQQEADRFIAVLLEEIDATEQQVRGIEAVAERATQAEPAAESNRGSWPEHTPWVTISMLAGDLDVRVDDSLEESMVKAEGGEVDIQRDGSDYRVSQFSSKGGDWMERLIGGFRRGALKVRLPPGFGLGLNVKAGDVTVRGVPYLRGNLLAGDLDAGELEGVDLTMQTGDLDLDPRPTYGSHRVGVSVGDVKVRLLQGSDTNVTGRVSIGEIDAQGVDVQSERHGLGATMEATLGSGQADLDLKLSTGQLTLELHDE